MPSIKPKGEMMTHVLHVTPDGGLRGTHKERKLMHTYATPPLPTISTVVNMIMMIETEQQQTLACKYPGLVSS